MTSNTRTNEELSQLEKLGTKISNDCDFRKKISKEALKLDNLLSESILNTTPLSNFEKLQVLSWFLPDITTNLNESDLQDSLKMRKPPGEGPGGPGGVPGTGGGPSGPGGGGGGCLAIGTKVDTPSGLKNIEDLKTGDTVITKNGPRKIYQINRYERDNLVKVDFGVGEPIICSAEHPFATTENSIINASNLTDNQSVNDKGELFPNVKVSPLEGRTEVFELKIENRISIYVGTQKTETGPTKEI